MKNKLRLYVWTDFAPEYHSGLAFAISSSESEARGRIVACLGFDPSDWGTLKVRRLDHRVAAAVCGGS